ncbi:MAG: nuclear transport factor 2 family protein [Dehalococcoidia bacterium]
MSDDRIDIARKLFLAWSSGDADAPAAYMTDDAVLYDIVAGDEKVGWPAIRDFFAEGVKHWPDLDLTPTDYWVNGKGVALTWVMTATVTDERMGAEAKGKKWRSEGMSFLEYRGDKVCYEVDYHHGGNVMRSLGLPAR